MSKDIAEAIAWQVYVERDNAFQRQARILQSKWRTRMQYPAGEHKGRPLGSLLEMPFAEQTLANYLTDNIRHVLRTEICKGLHLGSLFAAPRIYSNLLSSQPLCFNLFGELQCDLVLATNVFRRLSRGRIDNVTSIQFEHSPGRGDTRYTADRSAFDVYVEYRTRSGGPGFAGIEVKYHENMRVTPARHRERYDEVARSMGCFMPSTLEALHAGTLQQIWRDHVLCGSMLAADGWEDGFFALTYPSGNVCCSAAASQYIACLTDTSTFVCWTLEDILDALRMSTDQPWVAMLHDRYIDL